jgi:hypothetical protein
MEIKMAEQTQGGSAGGDLHPAFNNPVTAPANPPPEGANSAIDRTRGHSPARDYREQHQQQPAAGSQQQQQQDGAAAAPQTIKIGDVEYTTDQVNDALRFKSEQDIRRTGLPQSPDGYEVKLPADFKAPDGLKFEFDANSAELQNFRRLAHARGLDQQTFSEALGIYAANRVGEQQTLAGARTAEMQKLGSAANNRIAAVETWLKSQVGARANGIVAQLRNYPVAAYVEAFEILARNFANQGGADYSQSGRVEHDPAPKMPAGLTTFEQKRAWQDQVAGRKIIPAGGARR